MLTRSGVGALLVSISVLAGGRLFGLPELFLIGAGGLMVLILAVLYVAMRRLQVEVSRQLSPPRVHAGNPCRVDLLLRNRSRVRSPVLRLRDDVSGTQGVELLVSPMRPNAGTQAVYRLPTQRRGIVNVGPLRLTVTDPFGLAKLTTTGDREVGLVVYPHIHTLAPVRRSSGTDLERQTVQQHQVAPAGDEFYALREYTVGDDLRRVHWPSTARHDELMVRQDEIPWHGRVTVMLDSRPLARADVFEEMVSAAASVAVASSSRGDEVRLIITGGADSGYGTGSYHLDRLLAELAVVEPGSHPLGESLDRLNAYGSSGAVVTITTGETELYDAVLRRASGRYRRRVIVLFSETGGLPVGSVAGLRSTTVIPVPTGQSFVDAWGREFGRPRILAR
ncbi:MAG: DUF58 domain-containing protein [Acidimicrobiales bacterium]